MRASERFAVIEVVDQGQGIALDGVSKIFERFYQGEGVSTGLGLGLYISREIIGWHGGTIEVKTSGAEGTTMAIRLPLAEADSITSIEANDSTE